ncbi:TIM barrel protein [Leucobacter ruminantium]|uniref:TIM barrel protein n=1 Tax=Leucobacter ruminantium TaxID=1289170 RepID=A0A939LT81_9MICO|nr:TIM barrel protein [Leucobacter ruminantium]MBO1803921.1 TIM barrel protein [Leucobacter ruminantium]
MLWSISIQLMWDRLPFPDRVRAVAASGFDLVDLWDWRNSDIDAVHAACLETGIGVNGFFGTRDTALCDPAERTDVLDEIKRNLDVAVRVGARQLHVFSNAILPGGVVRPGPDLDAAQLLDVCAERLTEAADVVAGSGVQIVLEHLNTVFLPGYLWDDVRITAELVGRIDRPAEVGGVFDTFHQQLTHGRLTDALIETLPRLSRIDLAQVPGRFEPGSGEIDLGFLLETARNRGWDGTVTFECVPSNGNPETAIAAVRSLIQRFENGQEDQR